MRRLARQLLVMAGLAAATICHPIGASAQASNAAPRCDTLSRFVAPGETLDILTQCFDGDNAQDLLTLTIATAPTAGTVSVVDATHVRYVAGPGASGTDSFTIRATDPFGATSAPATIAVAFAANRVPTCAATTVHLAAGTSAYGYLDCSDPDGDLLTAATVVTPPATGTLTLQPASRRQYGEVLTFGYDTPSIPASNFTFSATVTDERGGVSAPVTVTIDVSNVAPNCLGQFIGVLAGGTSRLGVGCFDEDDDPFTITLLTPPAKGTVAVLTDGFPYFLYTAGVGQSGPDSFTYRALDSRGNQSGVATATLSISATNAAPSCPSIAFGVEPGASVRTPESFCQDPDAHWPVTHTIVTPPAKGTVRLDGESTTGSVAFRYTPLDGASGGDAFTFTATDAFGATSAPATATINIAACTTTTLPVRRAIHVWYGSAFNGASTTRDATQLSDLINDGVRAALISDSTIDARGKALAAFRDFNPLHTNIAWVVDPPQNLPAESRLRAALAAGMTAPVFDSVVDRGTKEYLLDLISNQELCDGGPVHDVQYEFRVSVSFHELNVREGNRAPACAARTASVSAGAAADIAPSCSDADLDPLTLSIASQGTKGVASIVGGQLRYTANPGTQGSDTFTYIASDGRGGVSPAAIVSVTINPVVTAPTIGIGSASVVEGTGSSPTTLRFTVSLSAPAPSGGVSVNFATANGTATAPSDFASRSGTLLFAAGEQSRPVDVAVVADSLQETNETLQLVLSSPVNATLAQSTAAGTIVNDDVPQTQITASIVGAVCVSEPGRGERGYAKFAVTLSAPAPKGGVTVTYSTRSITAKAGADFASTSGTLRFDAGQTMKRISVQIYPDNNRENDETFAVDLGTVRGATLGTGRTAIATISQRCQACDRDDER